MFWGAVSLLAWAVTATTAANVLLAEPETPNRGGAATLLISVPGALVPGIEYKPVVDAIRARANLTLWTAVLTDFVADFPTPPEALQGVLDAIAAARAAGNPRGRRVCMSPHPLNAGKWGWGVAACRRL